MREVVGGFRLLRCIRVLEDTEVFLGRDPAGVYAAVKFCRQGNDRVARAFEHEARIMRCIRNRHPPAVFSLSHFDEGIALISEWVFGMDVATSAAGMHSRHKPRNEKRLLMLCVEDSAGICGGSCPRSCRTEMSILATFSWSRAAQCGLSTSGSRRMSSGRIDTPSAVAWHSTSILSLSKRD